MVQALEPPRTNARVLSTPCFPFKDVVREGSVQSNHPELRWKNSTRLAIAAMMWFEKVRAPRTLSCNLSARRGREGTRGSGESALGSSALGYKGVTLVHDTYESARGMKAWLRSALGPLLPRSNECTWMDECALLTCSA